MNSEDKIEEKFKQYTDLAKDNPNVDMSLLMANALSNSKEHLVSSKAKRWSYLISIGVPPFGLLFALKYFFGDEDDARQVAWVCIALTAISVLMFWFTAKIFLSGSGTSINQIQQIQTKDILQLTQ